MRLQLRDQPVERGDGLGPLAAGVAQQDDAARPVRGRGVADDRVDAGRSQSRLSSPTAR
jgi:hypothetical protein